MGFVDHWIWQFSGENGRLHTPWSYNGKSLLITSELSGIPTVCRIVDALILSPP
jgi:hypothetical protein